MATLILSDQLCDYMWNTSTPGWLLLCWSTMSLLEKSFRGIVSGVSRAKIEEVTLDALRTRQSLVKGERLVRHEMRAVLSYVDRFL